MNKLKQYFSLSVVFWGAANLSQSSLAQYNVPMQPPVPRHDTMFPGVRERSINNTPSNRIDSTPSSTTVNLPDFFVGRWYARKDDPTQVSGESVINYFNNAQ
jgi:hypothetical protein